MKEKENPISTLNIRISTRKILYRFLIAICILRPQLTMKQKNTDFEKTPTSNVGTK